MHNRVDSPTPGRARADIGEGQTDIQMSMHKFEKNYGARSRYGVVLHLVKHEAEHEIEIHNVCIKALHRYGAQYNITKNHVAYM